MWKLLHPSLTFSFFFGRGRGISLFFLSAIFHNTAHTLAKSGSVYVAHFAKGLPWSGQALFTFIGVISWAWLGSCWADAQFGPSCCASSTGRSAPAPPLNYILKAVTKLKWSPSKWVIMQTFLLKIIRLMRDGKNNAWHELIIFVGSSPSQGDILFWNLILNGLFHIF